MAIRSKITYFPPPKGNARGPQQLALFNLKPENRWHLGYSPERKAEIAAAMPNTVAMTGLTNWKGDLDTKISGNGWAGDFDEIHQKVQARNPALSKEASIARTRNIQAERAKNQIGRTVARSTINPKLVSSIERISIDPSIGEGTQGMFIPELREMRLVSVPHENMDKEQILLHEMGHAADPNLKKRYGSDDFDFPVPSQRAALDEWGEIFDVQSEGFAEGFGQANFVPKKNGKPYERTYDDEPIRSFSKARFVRDHPAYKEGVKAGSKGKVIIPKTVKQEKKETPDWEQLSFDI